MPPDFPAPAAPAVPHKSTFNGPAINSPPAAAPAAPAASPKPAAKPAAPAQEAAEPTPAEQRASEKAAAALKKAQEGAKRWEEQKAARERAERIAAQERERATQASKRAEELERKERQAAQQAQRAKHEEELGKNPADWLKKQAEELLELKEKFREESERREKLEAQIRAEKRAKDQAEAKENFIKASKNAKSYPNLSKLPDALVLAAGIQIAISEGQKGNRLEDDEVLSILEEALAEQQDSTAPKTPAKKSSETNQAAASQNKPADTPRTITSEMSKAYKVPEDFDKLDDRQQRKVLAKMLKDTSKK